MEITNYIQFYGHSIEGFHGQKIKQKLSELNKNGKLSVEISGLLLERDLVLIYSIAKSLNIDITFYSDNNSLVITKNNIEIITPESKEYNNRKIDLLYCNLETDASFVGSVYSYLSEANKKSNFNSDNAIILVITSNSKSLLKEIEELSGFHYTGDSLLNKNTEIYIGKYQAQESKKKESKKPQESEVYYVDIENNGVKNV